MGESGVDESLPVYLRARPDNRVKWVRPTAWLLGVQVAASLKDLLWSATAPADTRDWMDPGPPIDLRHLTVGDEPLWLDFVSDTGDSPRLVYRLAYLLQQRELTVYDRNDRQVTDGEARLPRGRLLVLGGDIAYPVSTPTALLERVRAPIIWARQTLRDPAHQVVDGAARPELDSAQVPVVAVPGNHDLYNGLAGFGPVFRAHEADSELAARASLLPGYRPLQRATYFALRLPHDWQLLGFDVDAETLDERQRDYFRRLNATPCAQRIVVTSRPAFVYHAPSVHAAQLAAMLADCGVALPSLRHGELASEQLQLDLSGDVHLYERYWGSAHSPHAVAGGKGVSVDAMAVPTAPVAEDHRVRRAPVGNETQPSVATPAQPNYASVVSGLGGAFHHPGQIRLGTTAPVRSWPPAACSVADIAAVLMRPRKVFQAGALGVVGALVAAVFMALALLGKGDVASGEPVANILDLPLMSRLDAGARDRIWHFLVILGTIVASGGLLVIGHRWRRGQRRRADAWQGDPTGAATLGWWARLTQAIAMHPAVWWCMRWLGADRYVYWRVLLTLPGTLLMMVALAGPVVLGFQWPPLHAAADGFMPMYVLVALLLLALGAVGGALAPAGVGVVEGATVRSRGPSVIARLSFATLALAVAALLVWTPYAWTIVVARVEDHPWWVLSFFAYWLIRPLLLAPIFRLPTRLRRVAALLGFALLAVGYVAVPILAVPSKVALAVTPPWWSIAVALFFGAFFTCLWLGWYFLVCLQWNAHGNEAGSAARIAEYAQFLRIKLTRDAAEVWVIGAEGPPRPTGSRLRQVLAPALADHPIRARLIDHFEISRPRP